MMLLLYLSYESGANKGVLNKVIILPRPLSDHGWILVIVLELVRHPLIVERTTFFVVRTLVGTM